jgi:hypothetical protein
MSDPVPPGSGEDKAPAAESPPQPAPTRSDGGVKEQLEAIQRAERMQMQATQPPTMEAQIAVLPQKARAWIRAHPDYWTDKHKNRQLTGLHGYLTDTKGLRPFSQEYFDRLENELGLREPDHGRDRKPQAPEQPRERAPIVQAPPRSVPYAAPVTRGAPSVAGGSIAEKVVLSPTEVDMAHRSYQHLPKEQAEKLYWQMKVRMLKAKAAGEIQS